MLPDSVSFNKASIVERCIRRMREEYAADPDLANYTHVDALILNIERACQAVIDLAMHVVADRHLGVPKSSAEAFVFLREAGMLDRALANRLAAMTGFRNVAVHQYQDIEPEIIHAIVSEIWKDWVAFCAALGLEISP